MNAPQGTDAWLAERAGHLTASQFADILAKTKSGYSASRGNMRARLVAERMTGLPEPSFSNAAMHWGTEQEPFARTEYEFRKGVLVEEVGFIRHPSIEWSGASPDGLVTDDGLVEIKCPNTQTHIEYLLERNVPQKYIYQMQWQMECTGRKWCDFVSFDPRMPRKQQIMVVRVQRDEAMLSEMREAAVVFLAEVQEVINQLESINA